MTGFKTLEERTEEQRRLARLKNLEQTHMDILRTATEALESEIDPAWSISREFVPVLHSMIERKAIAEIGVSGFAILVVARGLISEDGTYTVPTQQKLSEYTGLSLPTVRRSLRELEKLGYIKEVQLGKRAKSYVLREYWVAESTVDSRKVIIETDYAPSRWKETNAELDQFERTGALPEQASINCEIRNTPSEKTKSNDEEVLEEELMTLLDDPRVRDAFENYLNKFK